MHVGMSRYRAALTHFGLSHFQHRVVGKLVRGKESNPILISLGRLNKRTGRTFQIKRVGDCQF